MSNKNHQIMLIGDSITEYSIQTHQNNIGWGALLSNKYNNKADILIRARESHTSRSIIKFIPFFLQNVIPDLVILTIGSNDASIKTWPQHVPLDEYKINIINIIEILQKHGVKKILLVTPPPMLTNEWNDFSSNKWNIPKDIKSVELTQAYAQVIINISQEFVNNDIYLVDLWYDLRKDALMQLDESQWDLRTLKQDPESPSKTTNKDKWLNPIMFIDGLHLSNHGNELFYHEIIKAIQNNIPELSASNIPNRIDNYW